MENKNGSVTVEAALVVPIAVIVCFCFIMFFRVLIFQMKLQTAMENAVGKLVTQGYIDEMFPGGFDALNEDSDFSELVLKFGFEMMTNEISAGYARELVLECLGEDWFDNELVLGGANGLDFYISELSKEDKLVDLRVSYSFSFPILMGRTINIDFSQRALRRMWVGMDIYDDEPDFDDESEIESGAEAQTETETETEEDNEKVYITKNGMVYHLYRDCQSLKRTVKTSAYNKMSERRNDNGGKYYKCEYCVRGEANSLVYYTPDGDRYHNSQTCGSLVRYIIEIKKKDAEGRELCKFCSKRQNTLNLELEGKAA